MKATIFIVIFWVSVFTGSAVAQAKTGYHDKQDQIRIAIGVADVNSGPIEGLKKENFQVKVNKKTVTLTSLATADEPVSVGLLIDTSGSFVDVDRRLVSEAVKSFVKHSNPGNEYLVAGFGDFFTIYQQFSADLGATASTLDKLSIVRRRGNTRLFDSIEAGIQVIKDQGFSTKVLFVVTDGQDNSSKSELSKIKKLIHQHDVRICVLALTPFVETLVGSYFGHNTADVEEISKMTGGYFVHKVLSKSQNESKVIEVAAQLARSIRQVYWLGIEFQVTENVGKPKLNEVDVLVDLPSEVKIRKGLKTQLTYRRSFYLKQSEGFE